MHHTKKTFKPIFGRALRGRLASYEEREAALPSYAHGNPLIDRLFWGRLNVAHELMVRAVGGARQARVLDFGCGSGVFSYHLAKGGYEVVGTDTEFGPLDMVRKEIEFPENCSFISEERLEAQAPFDAICALDVLEHVEDLSHVLTRFRGLLVQGGILVVSGPTENALYKVGRKIAGREFSGEYHVSNIADIKACMVRQGIVLEARTLYLVAPLFEIFSFRFTSTLEGIEDDYTQPVSLA